ncbi:hypothetical protein [Acidovorax sp. SUPP3334]|uniref:hypothetical protein n=1 Tax=Acidovorax sp. SUPP3334 TaxID=2920881 RepID=UPI0023DE1FD8|nr:hypothetical protein [Acidovorax sp. SUPP3334]GKT26075.1 hypothetical protein AVHM3334_19985 [Acidovorax sp. SUPP3334]
MQPLHVDGLDFIFPDAWQVSKYDEWSFYRNHFIKLCDGLKAVDVVALSPEKAAYLIEVKDYRHPQTEKPSSLADTIAMKVLHTLAVFLPAKLNASQDECSISQQLLKCKALHIVVHIEQSDRHIPKVDLADLRQKLKQRLRSVDPHPKIACMRNMVNLPWTVQP